jgi:hypothetical protein
VIRFSPSCAGDSIRRGCWAGAVWPYARAARTKKWVSIHDVDMRVNETRKYRFVTEVDDFRTGRDRHIGGHVYNSFALDENDLVFKHLSRPRIEKSSGADSR